MIESARPEGRIVTKPTKYRVSWSQRVAGAGRLGDHAQLSHLVLPTSTNPRRSLGDYIMLATIRTRQGSLVRHWTG